MAHNGLSSSLRSHHAVEWNLWLLHIPAVELCLLAAETTTNNGRCLSKLAKRL